MAETPALHKYSDTATPFRTTKIDALRMVDAAHKNTLLPTNQAAL